MRCGGGIRGCADTAPAPALRDAVAQTAAEAASGGGGGDRGYRAASPASRAPRRVSLLPPRRYLSLPFRRCLSSLGGGVLWQKHVTAVQRPCSLTNRGLPGAVEHNMQFTWCIGMRLGVCCSGGSVKADSQSSRTTRVVHIHHTS